MNPRTLAFALVVALSPATLPMPPAQAQGDKTDPFTDMARQRFQEGVKLFDAKKYEEARAAFLQAYALKKHPAVLLNLAQSELKSGHPVDAARHFSQYIQENPSPAERKTAEQGLAEARLKTGRVQIDVNVAGAEVFVDDELVGKAPLREPIDVGPGAHKIEARFAGYPNAQGQVTAATGQVVALSLKLDKGGSSAAVVTPTPPPPTPTGTNPPPTPANTASDTPSVTPTEPPPPGSDKGITLSTEGRQPFFKWVATDKVAWVTGGVTAVGLGMGIVFAIARNSAASSADNIAGQIRAVAGQDKKLEEMGRQSNPCAEPVAITTTDYRSACAQLKDNLDTRDADQTWMITGFVVAGLGAVGTGVAYYLRSKPKSAPAPTTVFVPIISPTMNGLSLGGTF